MQLLILFLVAEIQLIPSEIHRVKKSKEEYIITMFKEG